MERSNSWRLTGVPRRRMAQEVWNFNRSLNREETFNNQINQ